MIRLAFVRIKKVSRPAYRGYQGAIFLITPKGLDYVVVELVQSDVSLRVIGYRILPQWTIDPIDCEILSSFNLDIPHL